ncbi:hypothetical protein EZE20_01855 [Arundinibacter roseus]|uniref:Uncharacterized protein n=1 Tax=Arundinibacter roseus TaxID=2070510 RepID=A0A4R4KQQ4_9BACT|nr:hypothetical protein EZE20_01855 [Arundinibacter roseus]
MEEKPVEVKEVVPVAIKTPARRNMDRFLEATGKTEKDYFNWATEVGRRMHINKLDALVCAKLELYTVAHLANRATEIPEGMPEAEMDEYLAIHSENPYELAGLWLRAKANAENWVSKESVMNEWLTGIRKEDFERWGDKNHVGDISKKWWTKDAISLDVKLEEINSMSLLNQPLAFEDAIDFIKANKPGSYINPAQLLIKHIEERFKTVTTFRIKDYYVDHLMKMCHVVPANEELVDLPF